MTVYFSSCKFANLSDPCMLTLKGVVGTEGAIGVARFAERLAFVGGVGAVDDLVALEEVVDAVTTSTVVLVILTRVRC